jgi:hypothetical protein
MMRMCSGQPFGAGLVLHTEASCRPLFGRFAICVLRIENHASSNLLYFVRLPTFGTEEVKPADVCKFVLVYSH